MKYEFKGSVEFRDNSYIIPIPFNVWEVCEEVGNMDAKVYLPNHEFTCSLTGRGQGYYDIPVTKGILDYIKIAERVVITLELSANKEHIIESPYNALSPIRRINDIKLVTQPWDGLCGQSCIAMLAGLSLDEANDVMHCREWQANMAKMINTLDYLGIKHAQKITYTLGRDNVEMPMCCIIMELMGRYSHYLVGYDGKFYDPNKGIMEHFDFTDMIGYLEILVP